MQESVTDNRSDRRYELAVDGKIAFAAYRQEGDVLVFTHTLVPPALEGRGLATCLIAAALSDLRGRGLRIRPLCPFVRHYLTRHPEDRDLVAD